MNKTITLFASTLILAGLGLENVSALELPACVNKKTGAWRIVAAVKKCNAKTENAVLLNSTGQAGVAGMAGAGGPQGPQGVKGDKGDKGDTGAIGPKGSAAANSGISVYDANNQFIGTLLDVNSVFIDSLSAPILIGQVGHEFIQDDYDPLEENYPLVSRPLTLTTQSYFTSNDCSGPSINTVYYGPHHMPVLVKGTGAATGKYYVYSTKTAPAPVIINSQISEGVCSLYVQTKYTAPSTFELKEVILPFTLPLAMPLRFE